MCVGYIGLRTCNSCWPAFVPNLAEFGAKDQTHCFIALLVLKNFSIIFDREVFNRQTEQVVKQYSREHLHSVLEYCNQVLALSGLPP
mmetsp:Transcript_1394/g.897  ORF Transcript_1394/g.897 Transcript_1394/m.897 type:complete len:87 (-) Transcript_1394:95-355(-)